MRRFLLIATFVVAAFQCFGADVDVVSAEAIARRFLYSEVSAGRLNARGTTDLRLVRAEVNSTDVTKTAYYIFNSNMGYVIVSGDDRACEILAHGDDALDVNDIPVNMADMLSLYKREIEYLQAHPGLVVESAAHTRLNAVSVGPLLTAQWGQRDPYWNQCPVYYRDRCLTGCCATSLAQIFYYWKFPACETPGVPSYYDWQCGNQDSLPPTTFDWNHMRDTYSSGNYTTEEGDAVATLMHYIGQAEKMYYGVTSSGSSLSNIVQAAILFGYDETEINLVSKSDDDTWAELLQTELIEGRPVVYGAADSNPSIVTDHAFNVDGYRTSDDKYHVNFGWNGNGNGWYALNAFSYAGRTYNDRQEMIYGIQPAPSGPTIKVSTSTIEMEAYPGETATATFTVKGALLENDITLTLNDANGAFAIDANSVSMSEMGAKKVINVTYAPQAPGNHIATITLSCPGADDKTVTLDGTCTLETYTPEMLPADSAYIHGTWFRADWTDETPAANVASYTLEVGNWPDVRLLDEVDWSDLTAGECVTGMWEDYLPAGWTFKDSELWTGDSCLVWGAGTSITTPAYDLTDYDKLTVVIETYRCPHTLLLNISTSMKRRTLQCLRSYNLDNVVLDCRERDSVNFSSIDLVYAKSIKVYAGDLIKQTHRIIENITPDKFCTVADLPVGTYYYRVKAVYTDGTESEWSNTRHVKLFERGDVNHDGYLTPSDLTIFVDRMMDGGDLCPQCADVNGDGVITPVDLSALIDLLLGN